MGGLGAVGLVLSELRMKAQARRAEKSRESGSRRAMLLRHTRERASSAGKTTAQRIVDARRRRMERQALQASALAALRRRQQERAGDIAEATRGIRSGIVASVQTAAEQRRQNRSVPCPSGVIKFTLFGGVPSKLPKVTAAVPAMPSTTAEEAAKRAAQERARQMAKLEEHRRRMAKLQAQAEAEKLTAEGSKDLSAVFDGGKDTIIDQEMAKIEDAAANAEETKIASDEKEEQVNEIETLLEDAKDQLEEGKAQLVDENNLTPEMKALQEQINRLQGALTDAKIEHEESLLTSAEASQAQATMMQAEIDRLNALIAAEPQVADVVQEYIGVYEDDLIVANQDIADAESAVQDAQENISVETQVASQTSDEISETQPFYVRHRNILLLGGAAAIGAGYLWWKKQQSVQPAITANEGCYNLPEPKTPRHPSGL
jgi:DNA repair exonuclease SbcCD ATPase subunit